jgi:hypothetical protein
LANALGQALGQQRQQRIGEQKAQAIKLQEDFKTSGAQALRIRDIPNFMTQRKELAIMAQNEIKQGGDPTIWIDALNASTPDELNLALTRTATAAGNADELIAKGLAADEAQFEPVTDAEGNVIAQRNTQTGQVVSDPRAGQIAKRAAEKDKVDAAAVKQDLKATEDQFERSQKLRNELTRTNVEFRKVESAFERVKASVGGTAAGDLSLVFNYMKMLDPGSTVREGEFANAQNSAGVPGRIQSFYNNILEGTRLNPKQRKDFFGRAEDLFASAEGLNKKNEDKIVSIGKQFKIPKELILGPENDLTPEEQAEFDQLRQELGE